MFKPALGLLMLFSVAVPDAQAFGKKRPPAPPAETQAFPTRIVSFGQFTRAVFTLPNQAQTAIDLNTVLNDLVAIEMGKATNRLRYSGHSVVGDVEPSDRFILRGGLIAFEASNVQAGISFGYKNGADTGNGLKVDGKLAFTVGSLQFGFEIIDTLLGQQVAVGKGSALTPGVELKVELNVNDFDTTADFVYKSPLSKAFQKAISKAVLDMANSEKTNFLMDWSAFVSRIDPGKHRFFFDVGARDEIQVGNLFDAYDADGMHIGTARVTQTEHTQSAAQFKDDGNDKLLGSVREKDPVKIHYIKK